MENLQALHQMTAADNSGDGKLTLSEMVANPYVFYGSSGTKALVTSTDAKDWHLPGPSAGPKCLQSMASCKLAGKPYMLHMRCLLDAVVDEEEEEAPVHDEF